MVKAVKGNLEPPKNTRPLTGPSTSTTPDKVKPKK